MIICKFVEYIIIQRLVVLKILRKKRVVWLSIVRKMFFKSLVNAISSSIYRLIKPNFFSNFCIWNMCTLMGLNILHWGKFIYIYNIVHRKKKSFKWKQMSSSWWLNTTIESVWLVTFLMATKIIMVCYLMYLPIRKSLHKNKVILDNRKRKNIILKKMINIKVKMVRK